MKRTRKIGIAIVAGVLITVLSLTIYYSGGVSSLFFRNNKSGLVMCTYSRSGGMDGSSYFVTLKNNKDGTATLKISRCEHAQAEEETEEYNAPVSSLSELEELINSYKLPSWSTHRADPIFAYDADTTSLHFSYNDGKYCIVSSTQLLPRNGGKAFDAVLSKMLTLAQ